MSGPGGADATRRGSVYSAPMRRLLLLPLASLLVASPAAAVENAGAGTSLGIGVFGTYPAPSPGLRVMLPTLELAAAPGGRYSPQLRVRLPLLNTAYAAAIRQQLDLQADVFLLGLGGCDCEVGKHLIRPVLGPMLGARLNVAPGVVQPGVALGGRFGVEYMGPQRRIGVTVAGEPLFELRGGSAGPGLTALTVGGGALLVVAITGYQAP